MKLDPSAFVADPDLIQTLEKGSKPISCGGDRVLFRQGEIPAGLYILNRGELTLTMTSPSGAQVMQMQAVAGSLLGLPGLISGEPYTLTAVARTGACLSFVTRDDFISLMQTNPPMALKMLEVLAAEVRTARHALSSR
ncbi:MAG: Crp/Fnr family transcriptional regulator [Terracidiphilus sp.]